MPTMRPTQTSTTGLNPVGRLKKAHKKATDIRLYTYWTTLPNDDRLNTSNLTPIPSAATLRDRLIIGRATKPFREQQQKAYCLGNNVAVIAPDIRLDPEDQKRDRDRQATHAGHTDGNQNKNPHPNPWLRRKKEWNK